MSQSKLEQQMPRSFSYLPSEELSAAPLNCAPVAGGTRGSPGPLVAV